MVGVEGVGSVGGVRRIECSVEAVRANTRVVDLSLLSPLLLSPAPTRLLPPTTSTSPTIPPTPPLLQAKHAVCGLVCLCARVALYA